MFFRILGSFCLGLIWLLFVVQQDQWVKDSVEKQIACIFSESFNCTMTCRVKEINFFKPSIVLEDVVVTARENQNWRWSCALYRTNLSWVYFLLNGIIDMHILIEDLKAESLLIDGSLAVTPHIVKLLEDVSLPVPLNLKSLYLRHAALKIHNPSQGLTSFLSWHSESKLLDNMFKSNIQINDGSLSFYDRCFLNHISGSLRVNVPRDPGAGVLSINVDGTTVLPQLPHDQKLCFVTGAMHDNYGSMHIQSSDGMLTMKPIITCENGTIRGECGAHIPLKYAANMVAHKSDTNISGNCTVNVAVYPDNNRYAVDGCAIISDFCYGDYVLSSRTTCSWQKRGDDWHSIIHTQNQELGEFKGTLSWQTDGGSCTITNCSLCPLPGVKQWHIKPQGLMLSCSWDPSFCMNGTYHMLLSRELSDAGITLGGEVTYDQQGYTLSGHINDNSYACNGTLFPELRIRNCVCTNKDGDSLITVNARSSDYTKLEGRVSFPFVRSLIRDIARVDLQGDGSFKIYTVIKDSGPVFKVCLEKGSTIRLPQTYNFINDFDGIIALDLEKKKIDIKNVHCDFYKGRLLCRQATGLFDRYGHVTFVHVPLVLEHCLFNIKRDLFSIVSGNVVFTFDSDRGPFLNGSLFLERAQLHENLFSETFQRDIIHVSKAMADVHNVDMECDLSIATHVPVRVKTALFETDAKVSIALKNSLRNPDISGSIELFSGAVFFPYKPLHITKGSLYFAPNRPFDPIIEFVAKNKIKKYNVSLHITGPLSNHHVMLESTPPLTEEQIISLLLVGSHEESLNSMVPALIMHNIKRVFFDSEHSLLKADHYVKRLFAPFKYVTLVPSFSDQTGRGGLRGAIEIDSDRWRALIQKNFSLSEDIRVEFEYFLSDDTSFKAIRDERRDISGEIEMRWKF